MSEADALRSPRVIQVMQDTYSQNKVSRSKTRVISQRSDIAGEKHRSVSVLLLGRCDVAFVDIEADVIDRGEQRDYLSRAATDVDHLVSWFASSISFYKPFSQTVTTYRILKDVVQ